MRRIKTILTLQVISSILWLFYAGYLTGTNNDYIYQKGRIVGKMNLIDDLIEKGVNIPDDLKIDPDKSEFINLGYTFYKWILFYPAIITQLIAILLIINYIRKNNLSSNIEANQNA